MSSCLQLSCSTNLECCSFKNPNFIISQLFQMPSQNISYFAASCLLIPAMCKVRISKKATQYPIFNIIGSCRYQYPIPIVNTDTSRIIDQWPPAPLNLPIWQTLYGMHVMNFKYEYDWLQTTRSTHLFNLEVDAPDDEIVSSLLTGEMRMLQQILLAVVILTHHPKLLHLLLVIFRELLLCTCRTHSVNSK